MVVKGDAVGLDSDGLFNVAAGVQAKKVAVALVGEPPIVAEKPAQIVWSLPASTIGFGLTLTLTTSVDVQPAPLVTVTI